MFQRIVVPLDGSELAEQAIPEAEELARLTGAPIHLVRVVDLAQLPWYGQFGMAMEYAAVDGALAEEANMGAEYLRRIAQQLIGSGLDVDTEVRRGRAAPELVAAAKPGDVVVMASHGRGGITRWLLGSVAEDLLRHAPVPILLIKAAQTASDKQPSHAVGQLATGNGTSAN